MEKWTRRKFFLTTLGGGIAASTRRLFGEAAVPEAVSPASAAAKAASASPAASARPLIISSTNGLHHLDNGMAVLKSAGDTLDAALAVATKVEDDPEDNSVGLGGLPNEDGVVELDACVMHGPTH